MKDEADYSPVPWQHLSWSFRAMETGLWPAVGPDGTALEGSAGTPLALDERGKPFSAVLLFMKGDLEFMAVDVGLPM